MNCVLSRKEKAKPVVKQGRKATGFNETAGLPIRVIRFLFSGEGGVCHEKIIILFSVSFISVSYKC